MPRDEDEQYCLERLGIANAKGDVARRLREISPELGPDELLSLPLERARYIVVDLETTGMNRDKARIIEIGAVEVDGFTLGRELGSLVYPGVPVPRFISSLTGITSSMVNTAPKLPEALGVLSRMMKSRVLVAHNAGFDQAFLDAAWQEVYGAPLNAITLCTVKLSRRTFPELSSHNLDSVTSHLGIRPERSGARSRHRALGDARMTAVALVEMCRGLERAGLETVQDLVKLQKSRRKIPLG